MLYLHEIHDPINSEINKEKNPLYLQNRTWTKP